MAAGLGWCYSTARTSPRRWLGPGWPGTASPHGTRPACDRVAAARVAPDPLATCAGGEDAEAA